MSILSVLSLDLDCLVLYFVFDIVRWLVGGCGLPASASEVGVLTKLDLAEESGTAFEALAGEVYPLRLGYTAVVCRRA